MPIQNSLVRDLVMPLLDLDDEEVSWRNDRWRDHLETAPDREVDNLHEQILGEIARFEGNDGPPEPAPAEYRILMELYNTTAYVKDMRRLGMP